MNRKKQIIVVLLSVLITVAAVVIPMRCDAGNVRWFEGEALAYYEDLIEQGFPKSYAEELTELHLLHPTWRFVPLSVTAGNEEFTWKHVIERETDDPEISLISPDKKFKAYRHATNHKTYDSGYYQASRAAVSYFMDPRNFLNETDIFQFMDLSAQAETTLQAVEAVLDGSFMEDRILENGKSYAQCFLEAGALSGVNPVFLAVKARQEQGTDGGSPVISGACGDSLYTLHESEISINGETDEMTRDALRALNGYYNLFNVGAYGNGLYEIYQNAMERARKGSDEMQAAWGGDPSWDTLWKSIVGGALTLRDHYVEAYKHTIYLQKFNVHPKTENPFRNQYMQNVAGAMSEARMLYQTFAAINTLDEAYTFLIPVYEGMPKSSPDPARGKCSYLASADQKYYASVMLYAPEALRAQNAPVYSSASIAKGEELIVQGAMLHEYGIRRLEYSLDGGEWMTASEDGQLNLTLPMNDAAGSRHILTIRGIADYDAENASRKSNSAFLCAVIYVTVTE